MKQYFLSTTFTGINTNNVEIFTGILFLVARINANELNENLNAEQLKDLFLNELRDLLYFNHNKKMQFVVIHHEEFNEIGITTKICDGVLSVVPSIRIETE